MNNNPFCILLLFSSLHYVICKYCRCWKLSIEENPLSINASWCLDRKCVFLQYAHNQEYLSKCSYIILILHITGMTMIIQSSSVFTSTLTPLVGVGIVSMERMFPLTIGANIGTTVTGILAALAVSESQVHLTLQVALCHLFFNLSGTVLFYPIPFLRKIPIYLAKSLGNTTAQYRWFAIVYLVGMFFLLPAAFFALSQAGPVVFMAVGIPFLTVLVIVILVNILQVKAPQCLPKQLRTWNFLPSWLHSLEPYDRVISKIMCMKCCRNQGHKDDFKIWIYCQYQNNLGRIET